MLQNMERDDTRIQYDWASRSGDAVCSACGTISQTPAREYLDKPGQDSPQAGHAVWHRVRRQIYICENSACPQHDFVERWPGLPTRAPAKPSDSSASVSRGPWTGCKPAEDALKRAGTSVSHDSIGRHVKSQT